MKAASNHGLESRLKAFREALGLTQPAMAAAIGIGVTTLQNHELGRYSPKAENLVALRNLGLNVDWLLTGDGAMMSSRSAAEKLAAAVSSPAFAPPGFVLLPRYDVQASAGDGQMIHSEQIVDFLAFRADWVRDRLGRAPGDLLLIEANGDSMEPTIAHGDLLLVDKSVGMLRDSSIYVLALDGELVVKRVERRVTGGLTIKSDNPHYEPETVTPAEAVNLRVVGQVVWHGGTL